MVGLLTENLSRALQIISDDFGYMNFYKILKFKVAKFLLAIFSRFDCIGSHSKIHRELKFYQIETPLVAEKS